MAATARDTPPHDDGLATRAAATVRSVELRVGARTESVPVVRNLVACWLEALGAERRLIEDVLLVVTELTINAVEASPSPDAEVTVRAWVDDDVVVEVDDEGAGFTPDIPETPPSPRARRGRGLMIVTALTDGVEVERHDGRTRVTARRAIAGDHVA